MSDDLATPLVPMAAFALDPAILHLNHGSFGACLRSVLDAQGELRARLEAAPTRFFVLEWRDLLDEARRALARHVDADPDGLVFVANATAAVSVVLGSFGLGAGDQVLVTDHAYAACRNAIDRTCRRVGASVVVVKLPLPVAPGDLERAVLAAAGPRTRLALIDHVTSPTGLVLDIAATVAALEARGIAVLVDGAHAPGQVPVAVDALGASFYTANCHKWLCATKASAFLAVRADRRAATLPLVTSHGATQDVPGRSRLWVEHDWTGTHDPSTYLTVPAALAAMAELAGGWPRVIERNRRLALAGRQLLADLLGAPPISTADLVGAMATLPIALPAGMTASTLEQALLRRGLEAPIFDWPALDLVGVRFSAAVYNTLPEIERLGRELLALGVTGDKRLRT